MENNGILIDTTILIDFLRKKNKEKTLLWKLKETYKNLSISSSKALLEKMIIELVWRKGRIYRVSSKDIDFGEMDEF